MAYPFCATSVGAGHSRSKTPRSRLPWQSRKFSHRFLSSSDAYSAASSEVPRKVLIEPLEPRYLLAADIFPVDMATHGDDLLLRLDSVLGVDTLQVFQTGNVAAGPKVSQKLADTTEVVVTGRDDFSNQLTIDYSSPFFVNVSFDGGAGAGIDSLVITGGTFDSVAYGATGADSGTIDLDDGAGSSTTITYTGLEPVADETTAANRTFTGTGAGERIRLTDDSAAVGRSVIDSDGTGAFESITFANPTNRLDIDGAGGDDTVFIHSVDATFGATITLKGGAGDDTLTGSSGNEVLEGGADDDTYVFAGDWGNDNVVELSDNGFDTLDFTGHADALVIAADRSVISSGTSSVSQSGSQSEAVDVTLGTDEQNVLLDGGIAKLVQRAGEIEEFEDFEFEKAVALLSQIQTDADGNENKVPVSLGDALDLSDVFDQIEGRVSSFFGTASPTLSGLADNLATWMDSAIPHSSTDNELENLGDLSVTGRSAALGYGGSDPLNPSPLEVFLDFDFLAERTTTFDLDLGAEAELIGLTVTAPIDATTSLDGGLKLGLSNPLAGGGNVAFFTENVVGNDLTADVGGTATVSGASVNFGFLEATVGAPSSGTSIEFAGALDLNLTSGDNRLTGAELMDSGTSVKQLFAVTADTTVDLDSATPGKQPILTDLSVIPDAGVLVTGFGDLGTGNIDLSLDGTLFSEEAPGVSALNDQGLNLLEFSNTTPSEVLVLLDQVLGALDNVSASEALAVEIPLAGGKTIGDVLDFAQQFKKSVLDILVQGDSSDPDRDASGNPILLFQGAQDLATLLPGAVQAVYDKDTNELTFDITISDSAIGSGSATLSTDQAGGDVNEIQSITIDAVAGEFRLGFRDPATGESAFTAPIDFGSSAGIVKTRLESLDSIDVNDVSVVKDDNVYEITFTGNLADTDVDDLIVDTSGLEGGLPIDFDFDLGDLVSVESNSLLRVSADAGLSLTFGLSLSASEEIIVAPPVFKPAEDDGMGGERSPIEDGQFAGTATFQVTLFDKGALILDVNGDPQFVDPKELIPLREAATQIAMFTIAVDADPANTVIGDLTVQIQDAIDEELFNAGQNSRLDESLGFTESLSLTDGAAAVTAEENAPSGGQVSGDVRFSLRVNGGSRILGTLFADDTSDNSELSELALNLQVAIQDAIDDALPGTMVAVTVGTDADDEKLTVSVTGGNLDITFFVPDIVAEGANGRISLSALPIMVPVEVLTADQTPAGGGANEFVLSGGATFTLYVNPTLDADGNPLPGTGTPHVVTIDQSNTNDNTSLQGLVIDLNNALAAPSATGANLFAKARASQDGRLELTAADPNDTLRIELETIDVATTAQPRNEVQTLDLRGAVGGTYRLNFTDATGTTPTAAIAYNASAAQLKSALEVVTGADTISVARNGSLYRISFIGDLGNQDLGGPGAGPLTLNAAGLVTLAGGLTVPASTQPLAKQDGLTANEEQSLTVNPAAGTFTLSFQDDVTGPILVTASDAEVQTALAALPGISQNSGGLDNVMVSKIGNVFTVEFVNDLANTNVDPLVAVTPAEELGFADGLNSEEGSPENVDRRLEIGVPDSAPAGTLIFDDPAFQELGLLASPVSFDGILTSDAHFDLIIDGPKYRITVVAGDYGSVAGLVDEINASINLAVEGDRSTEAPVQAFRLTEDGNRFAFEGKGGEVSRLQLQAPPNANDAAITELGLSQKFSATERAKAGRFFLEDVSLTGGFTLDVNQIEASASLGFIGVTLESDPGRVNKLEVNATLDLIDNDEDAGTTNRVLVDTLGDQLAAGNFDAAVSALVTGFVDVGFVLTADGGFGTPLASGTVAFSLGTEASQVNLLAADLEDISVAVTADDIDPFSALSFDDVLAALDAIVDYLAQLEGSEDSDGGTGSALVSGLTDPLPLINKSVSELLKSAREFADFAQKIQDSGAFSVQTLELALKEELGLSSNLPFQLSEDAFFNVTVDGTEREVALLKSDTENNQSIEDLASDLDQALQVAFMGAGLAVTARARANASKLELFAEGAGASTTDLEIDIGTAEVATLRDGGTNIDDIQTVTVNATSGTYILKSGIAPTEAIAFDASADDVKAALVRIAGLTENNVEVARDDNVYTITFIDKGDFGELTVIDANLVDETTTAELGFTKGQMGTGTLTADNEPEGEQVLELDLGVEAVLRFDLSLGFGARASLPFDLDLAQVAADNPELELFASLVGVEASGNLNVDFNATLDLALGLSLSTIDGVSAFLFTGEDGTKLSVDASITGDDLDFKASIASFTVEVEDGMGFLGGGVTVTLDDSGGERFGLEQAKSFSLSDLVVTTGGTANLILPLFVDGKAVNGNGTDGLNELRIDVPSLQQFFTDPADVVVTGLSDPDPTPLPSVIIRTPEVNALSLLFGIDKVPSLLEILSNPAVVVDGLDSLLQTLQDGLNGEVLGISLPLVGEALGPAAQVIEDFRADLLRPLGDKLREDLSDPPEQLRRLLFDVFGPEFLGGLGLLLDEDGNPSANFDDIRRSGFKLGEDEEADFLQFDLTIGQTFMWDQPIGFNFDDLPAIGLELDADLQVEISWSLDFGFGVDERNGFYFVTADEDELSLTAEVTLGDDASASGQLGFLVVDVEDGITVDDGGTPGDSSDDIVENTRLFLNFAIDLLDPNDDEGDGSDDDGSKDDGRLGFAELISSSPGDLFDVRAVGGADLRLDATVNFSGLGLPGPLLPSIGTEIFLDWDLMAGLSTGFEFGEPEVAFKNIEVDLGSFITEFASPILGELGKFIKPLDFLIGPKGLLNLRLPIISDLAGSAVTIKSLAEFLDREAKIVPFLNAVEEIFFLTKLVNEAAAEANRSGNNIVLSFGDLDINSLIGAAESLKDLKDLKGASAPTQPSGNQPGSMTSPNDLEPGPSKTFTKSVTRGEGSFNIDLLKPENIFKLLLGQGDVTLFTYNLPEFGFSFTYRQEFPVFGPLVAFLGGSIEAGVDLAVGYDTRGLEQFQATGNLLDVANGFFISDVDLQTGADIREAFIIGEIFAGGGLSIGIAKGGVEGGIRVTINFNLNDPDRDGKVRLGEIAANVLANLTSTNPLLVASSPISFFDVSGMFEAFLRAFVEVNLLFFSFEASLELAKVTLFEFDIPFERVSSLAQKDGSTLLLNVGENAASRFQGNTSDISETIFVKSDNGAIKVWSPQFNVPEVLAQSFVGITKIVAFAGEGNDVIDLSRVTSSNVTAEIRGGAGRDRLVGGRGADELFGDGGDDTLIGGNGNDFLDGGAGKDVLRGGIGNDELLGGTGNDLLLGQDDNDILDGGLGNDNLNGDLGDDTYIIGIGGGFDSVTEGSGGTLDEFDFSSAAAGVTFVLENGKATASVAGTPVGEIGLDVVDIIIGSRFADTFTIREGGDSGHIITLDGRGASDRYTTFGAAAGAFKDMNVTIRDTGNSWDNDVAIAVGTNGADLVTITDSAVTFEVDGSIQTFGYDADPASPAEAQPGIEFLEVRTGMAGDRVRVLSTPASVAVKVVTGEGDDLIAVGDGTPGGDGLNEIKGQPIFGPLVIDAGGNQDTLIIDDSPDTSASTEPTELGLRTEFDSDGKAIGQMATFSPSALTATSSPTAFVLSDNAGFSLSVNGDATSITILRSNTDGTNDGTDPLNPGGGDANAQLSDLVNDVNFALFQAGLEGIVAARATEDLTRIELYAVNLSDEIVISGLTGAAGELGFTEGQISVFEPAVLTSEALPGGARENEFVLGGDAVFTIGINGGETQDVVLLQPRSGDNATLDDLVQDLNDVFAIPNIGLSRFLEAVAAGDKIQLVALNPSDSFTITYDEGDDVTERDDPTSELGFTSGQSSAGGVLLADNAPSGSKRFVLDNDVSFTLSLPANIIAGTALTDFTLSSDVSFTLNVNGTDFDVTVESADTSDNTTLAGLIKDLNNAFDDAGVREFVRAKIIGDKIALSAVDAGDEITLSPGASALGFSGAQEVSSGGPQLVVTLFQNNTNGFNRDEPSGGGLRNISLDDLVDDVRFAISQNAKLAGVIDVQATADGRIELFAVNEVDQFELDFLSGRLDERTVEDALGNDFDQATMTGLGTGEGIEFSGAEEVVLRLGIGHDQFTLGEVSEGTDPNAISELRMFGGPGVDRLDVRESLASTFLTVSGGSGDDLLNLLGTQTTGDPTTFGTTILGEDINVATIQQGVENDPVAGLTGINEVQKITIGETSGFFTLVFREVIEQIETTTGDFQEVVLSQTTRAIAFDATKPTQVAADIEDALEELPLVGDGNVVVSVDADGGFLVEFVNDPDDGGLGNLDVAELSVGDDVISINGIDARASIKGGAGSDVININVDIETGERLAVNNINALLRLDGGSGGDDYNINLAGSGSPNFLIEAIDGGNADSGADIMTVSSTDAADDVLLRAGSGGLAFVAMLNTGVDRDGDGIDDIERVNYDSRMEGLVVNTFGGKDIITLDDNAAITTINSGTGDDRFQIGQLFNSRRDSEVVGIATEDFFATIETTRGFLSNGITEATTINAGDDNDDITVFHNLAVLSLNGGEGDDTFTVRAFALAGSQDDLRQRTDISGDAGVDTIQYAVNAPVNIDGGDGFDIVKVIGTEFSDDFVITERGVFGAGLNVNFEGVEGLTVDGAEGDDRFFIVSTNEKITTQIIGGKGSDTFVVNGETPSVISNDLLGHSGVISHSVIQTDGDGNFNGIKVNGVSVNVADNDEPGLVITQSGGSSRVSEGDDISDSYTVVLTRRPEKTVTVTALAPVPPPEDEGAGTLEFTGKPALDAGPDGDAALLTFDENNWFVPQTITFQAVADEATEGLTFGVINHTVASEDPAISGQAETINGRALMDSNKSFTTDLIGRTVELTGGQGEGQRRVITSILSSDTIEIAAPFEIDEVQTITVSASEGSYTLSFDGGVTKTMDIAFDAAAAVVQGALEKLDGIGPGNVAVNSRIEEMNVIVYTVRFQGALSGTNVDELTTDETGLNGGTAEVEIAASSAYRIRVTDALIGLPTEAVQSTTFEDNGTEFKGQIFTDLNANFPTLNEGLRAAEIEITSGPGVGQKRLIASNTDTALTLFKPFDLGAEPAAGVSTYKIKRFDGLTVPSVPVEIIDNEEAGVTITQTNGGTQLIETNSTVTFGAVDSYEVSLTRAPVDNTQVVVRVDLDAELVFTDAAGNVLTDAGGEPLSELELVFIPGELSKTVFVKAVNDLQREGFHNGLITHTIDAAQTTDSDFLGLDILPVVADIADDETSGVLVTESNGSTNVIEGETLVPIEDIVGNLSAADADVAARSILVGNFGDADLTGKFVRITSGPGALQERLILANSETVLLLDKPWDSGNVPNGTSSFQIFQPEVLQTGTLSSSFTNTTRIAYRLPFFSFFRFFFITRTASVDTSDVLRGNFGSEDLSGKFVEVKTGNVTETRQIISNTSTKLVTKLFNVKPRSGSTYRIVLEGEQTVQTGSAEDTDAGAFVFGPFGDNPLNGSTIEVRRVVDPTTGELDVQERRIVANSETVILTESDWDFQPQDGDEFTITTGVPFTDTYTIVLTRQPDAPVTVKVIPEDTRTSRGQVVTFNKQVSVSSVASQTSIDLIFDASNWNVPQTVAVSAIDDIVVDGGDTKVFATTLDVASKIQGPLFIQGGFVDEDISDLSNFDPKRLPGETNATGLLAPGAVNDVDRTVTVIGKEIANFAPDLSGFTIRFVQDDGEISQAFSIESNTVINTNDLDQEVILTLDPDGDPLPTDPVQYIVNRSNPNFFVIEEEQVDFFTFNDTENANSFDDLQPDGSNNPLAEGRLFFETSDAFGDPDDPLPLNQLRLTGYGMGADRVIGGQNQPGGITYDGLEVVVLNLGSGNNTLDVADTAKRDDGFQTWTLVNSRDGDDRITVDIDADKDGNFAVAAGRGNDVVDGSGSTQTLVVFGEEGTDTITGGETDDILFGDRGRVDYFDENGKIVTRLGFAPEAITGPPAGSVETATDFTLSDDEAMFPEVNGLAGFEVTITDGKGEGQTRTVLSNTATELTVDIPWSDIPDQSSQYRLLTLSATANALTDLVGDLPTENDGLKGLEVAITVGTGTQQEPRVIGSNTETELSLTGDWAIVPDSTSAYRISTIPEDQTDGVVRGPTLVVTLDPEIGATDIIKAGGGNDIVLGGAGGDDIEGGTGNDQIIGDHARLDYVPLNTFPLEGPGIGDVAATQLSIAETFVGSTDGVDIIDGSDGRDIVFGGGGGDDIDARGTDIAGDIIIGDYGRSEFDLDGNLVRIETTEPGLGGNDDITGGRGANFILGGAGDDMIEAGGDDSPDIILGDNGFATFFNGIRQEIATNNPRDGGIDEITAGDGPNVLFGGTAGDIIRGGAEDDIILGDHGRAVFDALGVLTLIETTDPDPDDLGGIDDITGGEGRDIVFGGAEGDIIDARGTGVASDIVGGDHGRATFENGVPILIETTDPDKGGNDTITGGAGANIILGGAGGDDIRAGGDDSPDIILGDNGFALFENGVRKEIATNNPADGGSDTIVAGDGPNVLLGGSNADDITGGAAEDIILGDNGRAEFSSAGVLTFIETVVTLSVPNDSGADFILGSNGVDVILGGSEGDTILAGGDDDSRDIVLGDNGSASFTDAGVLTQVITRANDRDGDDKITVGNGPDVVLGGTGNDIILAATAGDETDLDAVLVLIAAGDFDSIDPGNSDRDVILGDNGVANFTGTAVLLNIQTTEPGEGGSDIIVGGNGPDVIFGGSDNDVIVAGGDDDADDIVIGDNGRATFEGTEVFDIAIARLVAGPGSLDNEEFSVLSFNFNASSSNTTVDGEAGAPTAPAGTALPAPRAGNWNNLKGDGPTTFGDESGEIIRFGDGEIAPGITVQWGEDLDTDPDDLSTDTHSQIGSPFSDDERLFEGYLYTSTNHTVGVNIAGLASHFQNYDVYVYLDADDSKSAFGSSVRSISDGTTTFYLDDADGNTFTGTYVQVDAIDPSLAQSGNYVVFTGLTGDVAEIRIDNVGLSDSNRPAITAVQVVGQSNPIDRIESTDPMYAGDDILLTGGGADIAIGGGGSDRIDTFGPATRGGVDIDVVAGDNARATFMFGELRKIETTHAGVTSSGMSFDDTIRTGNGEDIVLGGDGSDNIDTGAANNAFVSGDLTILSLNFNSSVDKGKVTGVAGVVQADNWNNLINDKSGDDDDDDDDERGPTDVENDLVLGNGSAATGIAVEWGRDLDFSNAKDTDRDSHSQIVNPDTQNARLFEGYVHTSTSKTLGVDISGLVSTFAAPDAFFDVYVYIDADDNHSRSGASIRSITAGGQPLFLNDPDGQTFSGTFDDATMDGSGNYVVFKDLTQDHLDDGKLKIRIDNVGFSSSNKPAITAIQIVGGAGKDSAVDFAANVYGGDFDTDRVAGDNGIARLFGGSLYELVTTHPELGGDDVIRTGADGDVALGGSGADDIDGQGGHDVLLGDNARIIFFDDNVVDLDLASGRAGDGHGHEEENGFAPFDILGIELLNEDADGNDVGGNDTLTGGSDDDLLYGQFGNDTFLFPGLGLGHDRVAESGDDHRHHHHGHGPNDPHDTLDFSGFLGPIDIDLDKSGRQTVNGGRTDGDVNLKLTLFHDDSIENVIGSEFDDEIDGNDRNNALVGRGGNDEIDGEKGDDVLLGGDGDDKIEGGRGDDIIDGGAGNDELRGGSADDDDDDDDDDRRGGWNIILGGDGDDDIKGGEDRDLIDGEGGDDKIRGGSGNDVLLGGDGVDDIKGEGGTDIIEGGLGTDRIRGGGSDITYQDTGPGQLGLLGIFQSFQDTFFDFDGFSFADPTGGDSTVNDRPPRAWIQDFLNDIQASGAPAPTASALLFNESSGALLSVEESNMLQQLGLETSANNPDDEWVVVDPEANGGAGSAGAGGVPSKIINWTSQFTSFEASGV